MKVNLRDDEQIIITGKMHWTSLLMPCLCILCYNLGVTFYLVTFWGIGWLVCMLLDILTTKLILTNKRIIGNNGLFITKQMDSPLNQVNSISVESGILGKIMGYATLIITTSSSSYRYKYIAKAGKIKEAVIEQIDKF